MTRMFQDCLPYISACLDDAGAVRQLSEMPTDQRLVRIVGWQCGFEPMCIAVWSYLPNTRLDDEDAEALAEDYLRERKWFNDPDADHPADFVI